ncbi:hypothetical protein BJK05_05910 [Pectobacterium polaris]|uniref:DUF3021 family protein n=1 Tax=Pectobacterium polaris TaxID=2042057 RepID=UPI000BC069D0|nr:DUF3021 family protein [Pectobacterium polaris]ASY79556.1 hypothetical protein BJK05_05910 [Pectobacterium polaris]MCL6359251.1 DUF3021 family protein [Pectobacterium polaris]MCU1797625.1 DUF3021 family protein [Pectobacterium polaris]
MSKKPTFTFLILSILYGTICFFLLGIALRVVITYMYAGNFYIDMDSIFKTLVMSGIAGVAAGSGSWIFAKIDEHKARKSKYSDP